MKTTYITRLGFSDVFGKKSTELNYLLSKIDITKSLEILSIINKNQYKIQQNSNSEIRFILNEWLAEGEKPLKDSLLKTFIRISDKRIKNGRLESDFSNIKIVNKIATLRLIEILLSKKEKSEVNSKINITEENTFKAYLIINDEISERQDKVFEKWFKNDDIRLHFFMGLSHVEIDNYTGGKKLHTQVLMFLQFEKWLRNRLEYKSMSDEYLSKIEVKSWYEYLNRIFHINKIAIENHIIHENLYPELTNILDYFAERRENDSKWNELISIKKSPLYKYNDKYLILNFTDLIDKFFSGIYHDLIESSKVLGNKFHQDFSKTFVEEYLLINVLNVSFGKSYIQFSEDAIKKFNIKKIQNLSLPDYYVRNGNKLMLFECKNSYISNVNKIDLDFEILENEIKEKFYYSGDKKKAIKQLITYILNSESKKYIFFDNVQKSNSLRYYPILVVCDDTLTKSGFNMLVNEYFDFEKKQLDTNLQKRISPVTVIHMDDFLYYGKKLKKLDLLISEYHKYISTKKALDSMISFSSFLYYHKLNKSESIDREDFSKLIENSLLPEK